jgi:hypothetical protein
MMNTDFLINRANELITSFQIKNEWSLSISGGLPTEELFEGFIVSKNEVVKYGSILTDIRLHVAGERTLQFSMHVHTTWTLQQIADQISLKEIAQLYHFEKATKYGAEYMDTGLEEIEDPTIQFFQLHMPEVVLVFT